MLDSDILLRTTIVARAASGGGIYSTWPHPIAKKLHLEKDCLIEIAVLNVRPGEEEKKD